MATREELDTKLNELKQVVSDAAVSLSDNFAALGKTIADQAAQIATLTGQSVVDYSSEVAAVQTDIDALKALAPTPAPATPVVPAA